jgi:aspartyl/glutamyl-tRNA(Asn/Gln) amidotransferase C subunit
MVAQEYIPAEIARAEKKAMQYGSGIWRTIQHLSRKNGYKKSVQGYLTEISRAEMVTESDIEHIAELRISAYRKTRGAGVHTQFNAILDYFEVLDAVEGEERTGSGIVNVFREDEPGPCLSQEAALANAGSAEGGFVKAPRVM